MFASDFDSNRSLGQQIRRGRRREVRQPGRADRALQEEPDGGDLRDRGPSQAALQRHQDQRLRHPQPSQAAAGTFYNHLLNH